MLSSAAPCRYLPPSLPASDACRLCSPCPLFIGFYCASCRRVHIRPGWPPAAACPSLCPVVRYCTHLASVNSVLFLSSRSSLYLVSAGRSLALFCFCVSCCVDRCGAGAVVDVWSSVVLLWTGGVVDWWSPRCVVDGVVDNHRFACMCGCCLDYCACVCCVLQDALWLGSVVL